MQSQEMEMSVFIDREEELAALAELWGMRPQVALFWGRRRVGKSALLQRFAEGKPTISFQADQGTASEQLRLLTERMLAYRPDPFLAAAPLANWDQALAHLLGLARAAKAEGHPLLVLLDEFPYLVTSTPRLPSAIQAVLEDVRREDLPLFLVLAGSQIAMFEEHVLQGPLYGRRTWGQQLPPLGYREAGEFFSAWSAADRLRAWAVLGGIPYYLEQWDPARSLDWNVQNRVLRKGQVLYEEADLLVKEELGSEATVYLSVISAVASGATRQGEIADRAGVSPSSSAGKYLSQLRRLHILDHVRPARAPESARSGVWRVADGYLRFWFRFVRSNRTDLEARRVAEVFRDRVRPHLDQFVSLPAFEDACREHTRRAIGSDPAFPARGEVGAWWGPVPDERYPGTRRTREGEIELVAYEGRDLVLAGEAKWQNGLVDTDALAQLEGTVRHVPGYAPATRLVLYSREGFTPQLVRRAQASGVILRTVDHLYT